MIQTNKRIVGSIFGLTEKDLPKEQSKVLSPEKDNEKDRGKVLSPKIDRKIDRDKVLGTKVRFFKKNGLKISHQGKNKIYNQKIELLGNFLTFRNREKGLDS